MADRKPGEPHPDIPKTEDLDWPSQAIAGEVIEDFGLVDRHQDRKQMLAQLGGSDMDADTIRVFPEQVFVDRNPQGQITNVTPFSRAPERVENLEIAREFKRAQKPPPERQDPKKLEKGLRGAARRIVMCYKDPVLTNGLFNPLEKGLPYDDNGHLILSLAPPPWAKCRAATVHEVYDWITEIIRERYNRDKAKREALKSVLSR